MDLSGHAGQHENCEACEIVNRALRKLQTELESNADAIAAALDETES